LRKKHASGQLTINPVGLVTDCADRSDLSGLFITLSFEVMLQLPLKPRT